MAVMERRPLPQHQLRQVHRLLQPGAGVQRGLWLHQPVHGPRRHQLWLVDRCHICIFRCFGKGTNVHGGISVLKESVMTIQDLCVIEHQRALLTLRPASLCQLVHTMIGMPLSVVQ